MSHLLICPNCKAAFRETEEGRRGYDDHLCHPPEDDE